MDRWATFDCYGTLVDWERGIGDTLVRLWPDADRERLLADYHEIEPRVQAAQPGLPYREVLARTLEGIAELEHLPLDPTDRPALSATLPEWPVFPEVYPELARARLRGWRLGILSNTDPDLLKASVGEIGLQPDVLVTAAEAGSYKPAHGHWQVFEELTGADRSRWVHVAASLFHDVAPARDLGLQAVWINRRGETSDLPRAAELPDLTGLADTLDGIVSGG